nr:response regulator [Shimia biformata]
MRVLIVVGEPALGTVWMRHLQRMGAQVDLAVSIEQAIDKLRRAGFDVVILDLDLPGGGALSVADYAGYRRPKARVIFVTNSSFFSDGSVFSHCANACAMVRTGTSATDLAALVEHYADAD